MPKHAANAPRGASPDPSSERSSDERIGLTEAFAPVGSERSGEEGRIGLTEAFSPVGGSHVGGFSYRGDNEDEYPDALESLEPALEPSLLFDDGAPEAQAGEKRGRHGKGQEPDKRPLPPHLRKSRRMRRILIAVVVLLVLLIGALGYFTWRLVGESQMLAAQQTQQQQSSQEVDAMHEADAKDAATTTAKKTEVPHLVGVLGLTRDEAVEARVMARWRRPGVLQRAAEARAGQAASCGASWWAARGPGRRPPGSSSAALRRSTAPSTTRRSAASPNGSNTCAGWTAAARRCAASLRRRAA